MNLRRLEMKDAPFMLKWMQDPNVTVGLQKKFADNTLLDCERFIELSKNDKNNLHMAIVDDNDTYMGTVSLKNISNNSAEFAIAIRTEAMGKGYSKFAMTKIIEIGFNDYDLKNIYWNVLTSNFRAIRFYDKNGYKRVQRSDLDEFLKYEKNFPNDSNKYIFYLRMN